MKKNDDPCLSVCRFDGKSGFCVACGRSVREIKAWRKMTPFRREALRRELPRRVQKLAASENA